MALLAWSNTYSVGVNQIDAQHQKIVELINLLHDSMKAGKGKELLGKILNELADYTVYHFSTEERLFEQYNYPDKLRHKKIHDDLVAKVIEIKNDFESGKTVIAIEVMNFLKEWLTGHILNEDKKSALHLVNQGLN